jgi:UDP-glucose 4-epimerase
MKPGAILVTGGAGYIGSHTAWACLDAGREVVVLDDLSTGRRNLVPPKAAFVEGSVEDRALVDSTLRSHGVSAVLHFAAKTVVPDSIADPISYYRTNLAGSAALIDAVVACGVEVMVFSSTAAVYDPAIALTMDVDEGSPLAPISPYGRSKLMVEQLLSDIAAATQLRYAALRYFNVAGADPAMRSGQSTPNATHLIKVACETAAGKRPAMNVYGLDYPTPDGSCVRDFIHVTDLAEAHLLALKHLETGGAPVTLNCGYGRGASVLEVIAAVERASGRPLPVRHCARRPGDASRVVSDPSRLRDLLSWRPKHDSLDEIVESALRWERLQGAAGH